MFAKLLSPGARKGLIGLAAAAATALLLGALALTPRADAQSRVADMTEEERKTFREEVRAYLLEEPEIIIEALELLESRAKAIAFEKPQRRDFKRRV